MTIQRLEDMQRELVTLSDASHVPIEAAEVLSEDGVLVSGASGHKLESARLTILGSVRGVDTGAGAALRWDEPQAIRWIPEQTSAKEWWGIVMKQTRGYDALGRDRITFAVLQDPGHALLHSRVVGLKGPETAAVGAFGDDVAKALVTSSFTGAVAGVSLVWDHAGTLAVDADTSDAGQLTVATEWEDRWLDEVIDELADEYGFDWELRPSVTPGGIVWTFSTSAPRGGIDRTSGANRVVIDGFAGSAPEGERFLDRTGAVNAWTDKAKALARTLAASVAQWGTWFGVSGSEDTEGLDIDLELSREQDGSSWTFVAHALGGACEWMTDFGIGDLVLKANAKTGELAAPAVIEALEWSWRNGIFQPRLRFGDGKPTLSHKQKEKGGGKGGGRSGSGRNIPPKFEEIHDQIAPIAGMSEAGSINKWPKVDHRHKAQIHTPDAGEVGPHDDGHWVFTSDDASVTITGGGAGTGVIDFAAADGHDLVTLDANADTILSLNVQELGLDTQAANTVWAGPASGAAAVPAFRALASGDLPQHAITGDRHSIAAAQYQVVGATALNTLGLLTPTTTGAANSIVRTDANGYVTAVRLRIDANNYIFRTGNDICIVGGVAVRVYPDGTYRYVFTANQLMPVANLTYALGDAGLRWSTIFGGDVDISTAKGIIHADGNQAGRLLVANGTRYVPGTGGNIAAPGSTTQVIFNDGGVFGASANFTFNKTTRVLTIS